MPIFEFQCTCGLRFDASVAREKRGEPRKCPECGDSANPCLPATVAGHFKKDVTGPVPQNTGIADLDAHIDRVIGQSAAQGWEQHEKRVDHKREVIARSGVSGGNLSRTVDGDYIPLKPEEKAAHDRALAIHNKAMDWHAQQKGRRR